jgi:hypothetical protein
MSSSNRALRESLDEETVPYTMPLTPDYAERRAREKKEDEELDQLTSDINRFSNIQTMNVKRATKKTLVDGKPASMLTFSGHDGVQGFFEFLLNRKYARKCVPVCYFILSLSC